MGKQGGTPPSPGGTEHHGQEVQISVLLIDDESDLAEMGSEFIRRENEDIRIDTQTDPQEVVGSLTDRQIDCIVSDYDMPGLNGLELLEEVRHEHPDLPFILFTGKGSEEIAAEAISAGVTDYLQKESNTDLYKVLANRIENAVSQYRAEQEVEETKRWYGTILEHSSDYVMVVDGNGVTKDVTPPIERVMGYEPEEVVGKASFEFTHPDDLMDAMQTMTEIVEDPTLEKTVEFRAQHADGSWRWLEVRGRNLLSDPVINGILVNVRDITERKEREQVLKRQTDRLESFMGFLSHDLQNQVTILEGNLQLAQQSVESERLETAKRTATRISEMVANYTELAEKGNIPTEVEESDVATIAERTWQNCMPAEATLRIEDDITITADEDRVYSLFENLFQNAKRHVGPSVTVRIGRMDDSGDFFVEDDGDGIPEADREDVFTSGFTTADDGHGLGLAIVKQVADAHGWTLEITEGDLGGARFEFRDV